MKGSYKGSNLQKSKTNFKSRNAYANDHPSVSHFNDPDMPASIDFWDPKTTLYGRVDVTSDAVFLNDYEGYFMKDMRGFSMGTSGTRVHINTPGTNTNGFIRDPKLPNLVDSASGEREVVVDFVADAFAELKLYLAIGLPKIKISGSPYAAPEAVRGWINPTSQYHVYMSAMFNTFIETYLNLEQRNKKIKKFEDFVKMFFELYVPHMGEHHPITRTGFLLSGNIGPQSTGLCIELSDKETYDSDREKVNKYINDPTYVYFSQVAAKFGFYMDKNVPWRLVANLNSQNMKKKMGTKNINTTKQFFNKYYLKSHTYDMQLLKEYLIIAYKKFISLNPLFTINRPVKMRDLKAHTRISSETVYRQEYYGSDIGVYSMNLEDPAYQKYWFKTYLTIRLAETGASDLVNEYKIERVAKKALDISLYSGYINAVNYINNYVKRYTFKSVIVRKDVMPYASGGQVALLPRPTEVAHYGILNSDRN